MVNINIYYENAKYKMCVIPGVNPKMSDCLVLPKNMAFNRKLAKSVVI